MARTLRIGEFAELLGVTTKAIRHYHRIGVLPEPARGENGYRQYGFDSVLHALRIVRLRQIGLPLRDIGTVIAEPPGPGTTTALLHRLAGDIDREIERLQARRERVLDLIGEADRQDPVDAFSGPSPTMQLILNRLGGALDDAPAELLAQEQRTWEVLDALPGLDTAAWAEGLVNELEADPQWLETMRSMLPELARITDLPPEDPLVTEAARRFVASHDVSTFLDCPSGAGAPVPAAYAAVIQDIVRDNFTPSQMRFLALVSALRTVPGEERQ
jgi:DNA-binding transcriptional MerR regulator